ncbi:hypothetical protein GCM10029978_065130 [Actinoallomurus acanthiterrae]
MLGINQLVDVVFLGLPGLLIDDVTDEGELIRLRAHRCPYRARDVLSRPPVSVRGAGGRWLMFRSTGGG